ncbi:MAG: AbiV family abortive infection protein [Candidatus Bathyarchaeota archaeon]|nr:AbiV family abortive infection protein [Candidatus Bathyarchaeota archaeon]
MKTFLTLSADQAKGLDQSIFENAEELYQNANLLVEHAESYSKATSLMVLSLEETIKAIILKLHSEGLDVYKIEGLRKFVRDHKIRHQVAQLIEMGAGLIEIYDGWTEAKKSPPKFKYNWINNIVYGFQASLKIKKPLERIQKLQNFDTLKNHGLYTGFKNGLINPKQEVSKKDFEDVKSIVERTRNFHRLIQIIYRPVGKNSSLNKRNENLKVHLTASLMNL